MTVLRPLLTALGLIALLASPAQAEEPCGGLRVAEGVVELGAPLSVTAEVVSEAAPCLKAIATELTSRPAIRSITVAARVSGDANSRRRGFAVAKAVADKLGEFGLDRSRVSTVVPTTRPGEADNLQIAFVQRRSFRPVAQVYGLSGKAWIGARLGALEPAALGSLITPRQYFETGSGSVAIIKLIDGSRVRVTADSVLRIGSVTLSGTRSRNVQLEVLRGEAVVHASSLPGPFRLVTGNAIAGVRGTTFRLALGEEDTTRLETIGGTVNLAGNRGNVFVTSGEGSRVDFSGYPEKPRPLLVAPKIVQPVLGDKRLGEILEWQPVSQAKKYRVEFSKNAQFADTYWFAETDRSRSLVGEALTPGKWFWRVTAIDRDGFVGFSSKIYAFTVVGGRATQ